MKIKCVKYQVLFLLFITQLVFAQTKDSTMMQKWSVGFTFSPDYSFRIPYNTSTASSNISEKGVFAFTSGVHTQLQLSKILALELGVLYTSMGSKVHVPALNAITTGGTYDPSLPYIGQGNYMSIPERKSIYRYRFISIPFKHLPSSSPQQC